MRVASLELADPAGYAIDVELPADWPGPTGSIRLARPIRPGVTGRRSVRGLAWHDDLGGMGAGYAAALGGRLCSALGSESDPTSQAISLRLADLGIFHEPVRVFDHPADWTLLITSGQFGDKLPIGFRGCHAALPPERLTRGPPGRATSASWPPCPTAWPRECSAPPGAGSASSLRRCGTCSTATVPLSSFAKSIES